MKENNTRLQYDDTSTSAGFPTNNWQIRANSSASGGESFLGFVDQGATGNSETGTIVFQVNAGAPANSLRVSSTGRVGLRTATPVLDLHMNTSNTPAVRFEQNSGGGFTAQTWDIGANEANFFVRDVTSGSRLPFRIRPGAPTSSVDISAGGDVGVGTASPSDRLTVFKGGAESAVTVNADANQQATVYFSSAGTKRAAIYRPAGSNDLRFNIVGVGDALTMLNANGFIGISTTAPTDNFSVNGTASKPGGGSWAVFSDERLKRIRGRYTKGLNAVMKLQLLRYTYKVDNALGLKSDEEYVGFGAQALQAVIPAAVTRNANGFLQVNNDPILWTMLNAIKEPQKQIEELKAEVEKLRTAAGTRKN
ncbi:MAG: tail fiber domain-containing protein [Acidobacteriota bacterium]